MPLCGSQITLCDIPIRFDTYNGCDHGCTYCFVTRKRDITKVSKAEGPKSLLNFIKGNRTEETKWCDWDIPLHWGGVSDPFQPAELIYENSLECLKVFKETQYPFVVSTKNKIIAVGPYLSLIKDCNCVVQFSAVCQKFDKLEPGASTFFERIEAASKISPHKRVIIRIQPYLHELRKDIIETLKLYKEAGIYGVIVEGIKYFSKKPGLVRIGSDYCYPKSVLQGDFDLIRSKCHELGLKFYSGENRLRGMGDDMCCCGIDGLGWKTNKVNLVHYAFGEKLQYSEAMKAKKTATPFRNGFCQDTVKGSFVANSSFADMMDLASKDKSFMKPIISNE